MDAHVPTIPCLSSVSVPVVNTTTKSNMGRKGLVSVYNPHVIHAPSLRDVSAKTQGRNLKARMEAEAIDDYFLLACSLRLAKRPLALLCQSLIEKMVYRPSGGIFSMEGPSSQTSLCQVDTEMIRTLQHY